MASLIKKSNQGLLHKKMGVKKGQKIPASKLRAELAQAKKTHNVKLEREVLFAMNMSHQKGN